MGLSSMMQGGLEAVGGTMAKIGTEELLMQQRAEIEALRDARLQELKLEFDATTRSRNVADAETERQRVETAAKGIAEGKTGLIAERAGLNDADYRGDEGVGVPVQKGQAVPTSRDRMQAQGKHAELAQLEERDKARARQEKQDAKADAKDSRDYALREEQAKTTSLIADMQYKTAKLAYDRALADAKIPPAVDRAMKSRDEELKAINAQIIKLQGDNMPVGEALLARKTAVVREINTLIEPYLPEDARSKLAAGGKPDIDKAHADAKAALATGKISLAEVNKRLASKGFAPLPAADDNKPAAAGDNKPAAGIISEQYNTDGLHRANPEHREAIEAVETLEKRLAYLKETDAADSTIQDVQNELNVAKKKVRSLQFGT